MTSIRVFADTRRRGRNLPSPGRRAALHCSAIYSTMQSNVDANPRKEQLGSCYTEFPPLHKLAQPAAYRWNMRTRHCSSIGFMVLAAAAPKCAQSAEQARRREAAYQSQLAAFEQAFKPGMTRADVEQHLRTSGRDFRQMCCMGKWKNSYEDLVRVGREPHPWHCSAHNVSVGFAFVSDGR